MRRRQMSRCQSLDALSTAQTVTTAFDQRSPCATNPRANLQQQTPALSYAQCTNNRLHAKITLLVITFFRSINQEMSNISSSSFEFQEISSSYRHSTNLEWQWHQLGRMQVCTSLQRHNHASTPPLSFLQAGCPSCRPTNSVKALKAQ